MAKAPGQARQPSGGREASTASLPQTTLTGVNAAGTKTIIVSALLEVTGQVRFGDGTDISTTITEKDVVLGPDDKTVEKAIWAGTKRRGVDRRTVHELRDRAGWSGGDCYIPKLCGMCPTCWLFGFTGTTQDQASEVKGINAKSRILYATSVSIQDTTRCLNRHSRNQVDERAQTTAGSAGIHEEEVIVGGTRFPAYTSLVRVLDWEIGAFAHAFLENLNSNRYTAASRGQGGVRLVDVNGSPAIVIDESPLGVFPFAAPKVPAWETDVRKSGEFFSAVKNSPLSLEPFEAILQAQGFAVETTATTLKATGGNVQLLVETDGQSLAVHQGSDEVMKRYYGNQAIGYLRQRQIECQKKLGDAKWTSEFKEEVKKYANILQKKAVGSERPKTSAEAAPPTDAPTSDDGGESQ